MTYQELLTHYQLECKAIDVLCPLGCGFYFKRQDRMDHIGRCIFIKYSCRDCGVQMTIKESDPNSHNCFSILHQIVKQSKYMYLDIKKDFESYKKEIDAQNIRIVQEISIMPQQPKYKMTFLHKNPLRRMTFKQMKECYDYKPNKWYCDAYHFQRCQQGKTITDNKIKFPDAIFHHCLKCKVGLTSKIFKNMIQRLISQVINAVALDFKDANSLVHPFEYFQPGHDEDMQKVLDNVRQKREIDKKELRQKVIDHFKDQPTQTAEVQFHQHPLKLLRFAQIQEIHGPEIGNYWSCNGGTRTNGCVTKQNRGHPILKPNEILYHCSDCSFDLCEQCNHSHGHRHPHLLEKLTLQEVAKKDLIYNQGFICKGADFKDCFLGKQNSSDVRDVVYHCQQCKFNLCYKCVEVYQIQPKINLENQNLYGFRRF
ncbi:wd-40 repeat protein [Stylonychia lemnae]|uniref:Wd-40 repeat protein n=1 Tax=Stylonychia lemnae TaxID=5949 RepID=A0A078B0W7_STYLE|nr:wd-40 repeat protein [Stylonychia lemnae]|eukprot:CDW87961.1 wd-40 repeat protein [Stylonychia lemnae]